MIVKTLTDNRNRTASEVKSTFSKFGGNLGAPGSVAYIFEQKGVIICKSGLDKDEAGLMAIEAGATDIDDTGDQVMIYTSPRELEKVKEALGELVESAELEMTPSQTIVITDEKKAASVIKLINQLDDLDDVLSVAANFDIDDEILEKI